MENLLGVQLSNYQVGMDGLFAGNMTSQNVADLQKAMVAGQLTGRDLDGVATSGEALKVESLENTLRVLDVKESDIVLWKKVPKLPAYNTVEEYNLQESYGPDNGAFYNEAELPEENDGIYRRKSQIVKFMGTTGSVSLAMQMVSTTGGSPMQLKIQERTMWLLKKANSSLLTGNSDIIPQEYNGYYKQQEDAFNSINSYYDSEVVIDLRGKNLRDTDVEDASLSIMENNGNPNLLMGSPRILSNYVKNFYPQKLIQPNTPQVTGATMGQAVNDVMTQFGLIELGYDKMMKKATAKKLASVPTSAKAPNAPAYLAIPTLAADATNKFTGFTGDYYYAVSAVNRYGESALKDLSNTGALITVTAGNSVQLTWTDGGGAIVASGYNVYRSKKNPAGSMANTDLHLLFSVSATNFGTGYDGGAANKVWDKNRILPDTESAFVIENSLDVWSFKQLAPMMKMDLAITAPANRFMVLMFGTPILYAPRKMVKIINVGNDLT